MSSGRGQRGGRTSVRIPVYAETQQAERDLKASVSRMQQTRVPTPPPVQPRRTPTPGGGLNIPPVGGLISGLAPAAAGILAPAAIGVAATKIVSAINDVREEFSSLAETLGIVNEQFDEQRTRFRAAQGYFGVADQFLELENIRHMRQLMQGNEARFLSAMLNVGTAFDSVSRVWNEIKLTAAAPFGGMDIERMNELTRFIDQTIASMDSAAFMESPSQAFDRIQRSFMDTRRDSEREVIDELKQINENTKQQVELEKERRESGAYDLERFFEENITYF